MLSNNDATGFSGSMGAFDVKENKKLRFEGRYFNGNSGTRDQWKNIVDLITENAKSRQ